MQALPFQMCWLCNLHLCAHLESGLRTVAILVMRLMGLSVQRCLVQGRGRAEGGVTTFWGELENRDSDGGGRLPWTGSHVEW